VAGVDFVTGSAVIARFAFGPELGVFGARRAAGELGEQACAGGFAGARGP